MKQIMTHLHGGAEKKINFIFSSYSNSYYLYSQVEPKSLFWHPPCDIQAGQQLFVLLFFANRFMAEGRSNKNFAELGEDISPRRCKVMAIPMMYPDGSLPLLPNGTDLQRLLAKIGATPAQTTGHKAQVTANVAIQAQENPNLKEMGKKINLMAACWE